MYVCYIMVSVGGSVLMKLLECVHSCDLLGQDTGAFGSGNIGDRVSDIWFMWCVIVTSFKNLAVPNERVNGVFDQNSANNNWSKDRYTERAELIDYSSTRFAWEMYFHQCNLIPPFGSPQRQL